MKTLKRKISFLDAEGHRARITTEITHRNGYPEFVASGSFMNSFGQYLDHIKPANHEQNLLINLWKEYHLKNVEKLPDNVQFWPDFAGHLEGILDEIERKEKEREAQAQEKAGDDKILAKMKEEGIDEDNLEAVKAYIELYGDDNLENFDESYQGEFSSDEDFARYMAEDTGAIEKDGDGMNWPQYCIDWQWAARELMMDYDEKDGHYFRIQ